MKASIQSENRQTLTFHRINTQPCSLLRCLSEAREHSDIPQLLLTDWTKPAQLGHECSLKPSGHQLQASWTEGNLLQEQRDTPSTNLTLATYTNQYKTLHGDHLFWQKLIGKSSIHKQTKQHIETNFTHTHTHASPLCIFLFTSVQNGTDHFHWLKNLKITHLHKENTQSKHNTFFQPTCTSIMCVIG